MSNLLTVHREHLERFRASMNLVGPGPLEFHFDDCDAALAGLTDVQGRWADLGTGAGFPGIPFAARFPGVAVELVDSRQKRCVFLEGIVAAAGCTDVTVRCTRIEALESGVYDGLLNRALAKPPAVAAFARRLLKPGGRLVSMLNNDQQVEHEGFKIESAVPYTVGGKHRVAVILRRL